MSTAAAQQQPTGAVDPFREAALRRDIRVRLTEALGTDLDGLILFGSRARGDADQDSDWDILVMLRDDVDWSVARAKVHRVRSALAVRWDEDVSFTMLCWKDGWQNGGLIRNIAREGRRL